LYEAALQISPKSSRGSSSKKIVENLIESWRQQQKISSKISSNRGGSSKKISSKISSNRGGSRFKNSSKISSSAENDLATTAAAATVGRKPLFQVRLLPEGKIGAETGSRQPARPLGMSAAIIQSDVKSSGQISHMHTQGGQIGRIFACWSIVFFGHRFENYKSSPIFRLWEKGVNNFDKVWFWAKFWAIWAIVSQTDLVTLIRETSVWFGNILIKMSFLAVT
jgi:hypothetical protein